MKSLLILIFSFLFSEIALAAACCGGGFAAPSIIAGDDLAQLTTTYSVTDVVVNSVDSRGVWFKQSDQQQVQTFRIEGSHIFLDRWQAGFSLPVLQRSYLNEAHSGLGDITGSLGYEFLPDWDYNSYRPKGIGFLQLTLPTGKAKAESEVGGLDSRGNGFWSVGMGALFTKTWSKYDAFLLMETHRAFSKKFSNSQMSGEIKPGVGASLGIGGGYNLKNIRLGTALTWSYEGAVDIEGPSSNAGAPERYATASLSGSYLFEHEWAGTLSYSDQTLIGSPINTSLGKTIALQIQKRWLR